jgi:mono/diheme cytochrome c family protein
MPAFSEQDLSDQDIDSIVEYLRHMAGRKAAAPDRDAATDR